MSSVKESSYLDTAEAFVQDFLAGVAGDGSDARHEGAFQGIIIAVDVSQRVVKQVRIHVEVQGSGAQLVEHCVGLVRVFR